MQPSIEPIGPEALPAPHAHRRDPPAGVADHHLTPALGALVRLFCARFMPEVEPSTAGDERRGDA